MARNYKQGFYQPTNPNKYKGDINNIVFRSSWERRFLYWCDMNPKVIAYASEEVVIPYLCQTDNKMHRYFVDFWARILIDKDTGKTQDYLFEIKPAKETKMPVKRKKQKESSYLYECQTYIKNVSKWKAAKEFAKKYGMKFFLVTENTKGFIPELKKSKRIKKT